MVAELPTLSVCIVTYERPAFLERCLAGLAGELADIHQVVVVDASATTNVDQAHTALASVIYDHRPDLAGWMTRSRNAALAHATGDVSSFIDDDVVVRPGWARALRHAFAETEAAAVVGRTCNNLPGEEDYDQPIGRLLDDGTLTEGFAAVVPGRVEVDHGIGANMSFRRDVVDALGGFRDDYPGTALREDTDMFLRVRDFGGQVLYDPDAAVDHRPAPHACGDRFDTRYRLYARRNHVVLLGRNAGLGSSVMRRWIVRDVMSVAEVPGLRRKVQRLGVSAVGLAWGLAALPGSGARLGPIDPVRRPGVRTGTLAGDGIEASDLVTPSASALDVSVVIPVLNAADTIEAQLDALTRQDFDGTWEVLVALQDCDDATPQLLSRRTDDRLRILDASQRRGAGFARNLAVAQARGEHVAFCDADDIVADDWLSQLVAHRSQAPVLAGASIPFRGPSPPADIAGRERELSVVVGFDAVAPTYAATGVDDAVRLLPSVECDFLQTAYSCSMLVRRAAFMEVGGFDLRFHRSHDTELTWRLQVAGHRLETVPDAVVYKRQRTTEQQGWLQTFRWARYDPALYRHYADHGMPRSDIKEALRSWWWIASRMPFARGARRQTWMVVSAHRAGRLVGSLAERVLYL